MKKLFILMSAAMILMICCKKTSDLTTLPYTQEKTTYPQVDFNTSLSNFSAFKEANSNSYVYIATTQSWTGFSTKTLVTVVNGVVVSRSFKQYDSLPNGLQGPVTVSWEEDINFLGTHKYAAEALTLDQVYDKVKNVWLQKDPKTNYVYFSTGVNGLIMNCGYAEKLCADDCFTGINITSIVALGK